MTETETVNEINEIEQLKAKISELEKKINKPKREYEPCECEICHNMFKNKYILKTHMNNIHNKERQTYNCPYCRKLLKSKYYLQKHISIIHADEIKINEQND